MNRWDDQGDFNENLFATIMTTDFHSHDNSFSPVTASDVQLIAHYYRSSKEPWIRK
jgi:hypothetical protein